MRITNLTSLASASSFVAIILDFQNRAVDMTNGDPGDYVPIQVVRLAETGEQQVYHPSHYSYSNSPKMLTHTRAQWTFTSIDDDILFSITNVNGVSALSYPSAEVKGASGTIVHQQAMTHTSVETSWILQSGETAFKCGFIVFYLLPR